MQPLDLPAGELLLRPWRDDDLDGLAAALDRRRDWSAGTHAAFAVVAATGGELLGSVSLHSIDRAEGDAEVGYWAFADLRLDRIELLHAVENVASGRVAVKAGFTLEGRLRRSHRYGDGAKHDELLWARLSDDPDPVLSSRS